ncbi:hypothetical protein B0H13DRAFT_1855931 [Mycena leptocephala]|nr:hypothetical protein B0H13DRAFT_1855931 [Mycena leptocephala]
MPGHFRCESCSTKLPTQQGLRSHIHQSQACTAKYNTLYTIDSSSEELDNERNRNSEGQEDTHMPFNGLEPLDDAGRAEEESDGREDRMSESADPPMDDTVASPAPENRHTAKRRRATVEDVTDEDDRWTQDFPAEFQAGAVLENCKTQCEKLRREQKDAGNALWYPFESEDEWKLARWLMTSGLSQSKIFNCLKLKSWFCHPFELTGDELDADGEPKREIVEMWYRNPIDFIQELLGNPAFTKQGYEPHRIFKAQDERGNGTNREYSEMWTAEWWWIIQVFIMSQKVFIKDKPI